MSEENVNHIVFSKNVIEFVTVANQYCAFVEQHASTTRKEFIEKMQKIFPLLYLKASLLPDIGLPAEETSEKFVSEVDYNFLLSKLSAKLGRFDSYQEVFDEAMQFSETAIDANLSENICDIYQDLKDFIMAYRIGSQDIMIDALTECNNSFKTYWGQKLVNGLRALHTLIYGDNDLNEGAREESSTDEDDSNEANNWVTKHFTNHSENPFE